MSRSKKRYSVAVFIVDLAYGGPEEGGWYYQVGAPTIEPELAALTVFKPSKKKAQRYAERVKPLVEAFNAERPEISSSNSEGRFEVQISKGRPQPYPRVRPQYE